MRTRAGYAKAGFVTAVPDIAPDLKQGNGGVPRYRWSEKTRSDIGALVKHLRGLAAPVYLVGTSRAALSVAKAAVQPTGPERPDAIVITSGMLMNVTTPAVGRAQCRPPPAHHAADLRRLHSKDGCRYSAPASAEKFKALLTKAAKVDVKLVAAARIPAAIPAKPTPITASKARTPRSCNSSPTG